MPQRVKIGGVIKNDCLATISVLAVKDQPGIAASVLEVLGQRNLNVQFVVQVIDHEKQDHMVLCVARGDLTACLDAIETVKSRIQPLVVTSRSDAASVAIFGPDFRERPGIAAKMFGALAERGVNILAISTSISTVTCIIELERLNDALDAIHSHFDLP